MGGDWVDEETGWVRVAWREVLKKVGGLGIDGGCVRKGGARHFEVWIGGGCVFKKTGASAWQRSGWCVGAAWGGVLMQIFWNPVIIDVLKQNEG